MSLRVKVARKAIELHNDEIQKNYDIYATLWQSQYLRNCQSQVFVILQTKESEKLRSVPTQTKLDACTDSQSSYHAALMPLDKSKLDLLISILWLEADNIGLYCTDTPICYPDTPTRSVVSHQKAMINLVFITTLFFAD